MRRTLLALGVAAASVAIVSPAANASCEGPDVDCILYCGPHVDPSRGLKNAVYWVAC